MPTCNGKNGIPKVDCLKEKKLPKCPGNSRPRDGGSVSPTSCRVLPECDGTNGAAGEDCAKGQIKSLVHIKHRDEDKQEDEKSDSSDDDSETGDDDDGDDNKSDSSKSDSSDEEDSSDDEG